MKYSTDKMAKLPPPLSASALVPGPLSVRASVIFGSAPAVSDMVPRTLSAKSIVSAPAAALAALIAPRRVQSLSALEQAETSRSSVRSTVNVAACAAQAGTAIEMASANSARRRGNIFIKWKRRPKSGDFHYKTNRAPLTPLSPDKCNRAAQLLGAPFGLAHQMAQFGHDEFFHRQTHRVGRAGQNEQ